ncbi:MAG: signal peptide peptidase SppA [Bacteroidetes bacterium]|nr:signal peptide peptidase SppA [Bacteroidota bacterium]
MKEFFKFMFASMLGFFLTLILISVILFSVVAIIASVATTEVVSTPRNAVLQIKLDRTIIDRGQKKSIFGDMYSMRRRDGLTDILDNIRKARNDNDIKGILLDVSVIPAGLSTISEIRDALADFKKSGKFIVSYSEFYSQGAYYLASVSDRIYLQPQGMVFFKGLDAEQTFIKGTLEKLDIKMQIIRHGKFKAATEPLFLDKMSAENRKQISELIRNSWEKIVEAVSSSRNISAGRLNEIADSLKAETPEDAVKYKLVDQLAYRDQLLNDLRKKLGLSEKADISFITLDKYSNVPDSRSGVFGKDGKIAVIYATGNIGGGNGDDQSIGSERLSKAFRKAREDKKIKAIVFRINSPGGSALASDVIWREVSLAAKEKPVVASFGDVAASGGYYIACPATRILADPTTITGSIGVFGVIPNLKGFFNNKLGITFDEAKTNANSDYISITKPMPAYQEKVLQAGIESIYAQFVAKVAEGRHLSTASVDSIGQGRVWSGTDAKRIGLVDEFGGFDRAIEVAMALAKIKNYSLIYLPEQKDPLEELIDQLTGNEARMKALEKEMGEYYKYYQYLNELQQMKGIQARMPFDISIN